MSKPVVVVVAIPQLQTDVDLNPRLLNVNLEHVTTDSSGLVVLLRMVEGDSDLGAFPHCSIPIITQVFSGFEDLNQQRADLATTRNMV